MPNRYNNGQAPKDPAENTATHPVVVIDPGPDLLPFAMTGPAPRRDWLGVIGRHWMFLLGCSCACAAAALVVGTKYCKKLWPAEATLIYQPLPAPAQLRGSYVPPAVETYTNLLTSKSILEDLAHDFDLVSPQPVKVLEKVITVTPLKGRDTIRVSVEWPERDAAAKFVNRHVDLFQERVKAVRRDKVLRDSISLTRSTWEERQSQMRKWQKYVDEYGKRVLDGVPLTGLKEIGLDGAYEMRKKKLQDDLHRFDADILEARQKHVIAEAEYQTQKTLNDRGAGAPAEFEKTKNELHLAKVRIDNLERAICQTESDRRFIPLEYANNQLTKLGAEEEDLRRDLDQLELWERQGTGPTAAPLAAEELKRLGQRFVGVDESEFKVETLATPAAYPSSTNRKSLTATAFIGPMALIYLLTALWDFRSKAIAGRPKYSARPAPLALPSAPLVTPPPQAPIPIPKGPKPPRPTDQLADVAPQVPPQESLLEKLRRLKTKSVTHPGSTTIPTPTTSAKATDPAAIDLDRPVTETPPEIDSLRQWIHEARSKRAKPN